MTNRNFLNQQPPRRIRERGIALVIGLLAMGVLTAVGFALMLSSSTETLIHANFRSSETAFYASRGGLEEIRGRMGPNALPAILIPAPPNTTTATYIRMNAAINPTQAGCTFNTPVGAINCFDPDAALTPTVNYALTAQDAGQVPYVWVKAVLATQRKLNRNLVTPGVLAGLDDTVRVCWDGQNLLLDNPGTLCPPGVPGTPNTPAYIFTALSIDRGGASRIIRQVGSYGTLPGLPSPLTLDGCNPTFQGGNSNQYQIVGNDVGGQAQDEAAIGVVCPGDAGPLAASIPKNKQDDYPGAGGAAPPPDVQDVSGILDPLYQNCTGLDSLLATLRSAADHVYTGTTTSLPDPGVLGDPVINFVDGDLDITGNWDGAGILIVTGDVRFGGNSTYDGVIYVIGTGTYLQSGGGSGQYSGGIFVANTTTCPAGLGSPSYRVNGGGNNGIQYDTDLTEPPVGYMPVQLLSLNY